MSREVDLLRYGTQAGKRYVARDVFFSGRRCCQYAVWDLESQETIWLPTKPFGEQGGTMEPFYGPDDAWELVTANGLHIWKT